MLDPIRVQGPYGRGSGKCTETVHTTNALPVWTLCLLLVRTQCPFGTMPTPPTYSAALCCCACCRALAGAILQFVRDTTTRVEGVGDVCSLAVFDFDRHGNRKYGALAHANKRMRSKQVRVVMHGLRRAVLNWGVVLLVGSCSPASVVAPLVPSAWIRGLCE